MYVNNKEKETIAIYRSFTFTITKTKVVLHLAYLSVTGHSLAVLLIHNRVRLLKIPFIKRRRPFLVHLEKIEKVTEMALLQTYLKMNIKQCFFVKKHQIEKYLKNCRI